MSIVQTFTAQIYIAGDAAHAKQICQKHCYDVGLCVTIEPLDFVYTRGCEAGIEEPFPAKPDAREWVEHKLTDESWAQWRAENTQLVAEMTAQPALSVSSKDGTGGAA